RLLVCAMEEHVRHARDVVTHHTTRRVDGGLLRVCRWQTARVLQEVIEKRGDLLLRTAAILAEIGRGVDALEQKPLERATGLRRVRREAGEARGPQTHLFEIACAAALGLRDRTFDQS